MTTDALSDFEPGTFTADGVTHPLYRSGTGPAVIVIAEIPGITPKVADFARQVRDEGFSVIMPSLFGAPGHDPNDGLLGALAITTKALGRVCVSREFNLIATGRTSPVVSWLRALAAHEHERCGGPGVGAVGMCLTGGFALAMATDERLLAPVLSQPSLPLSPRGRRSIDISAEDLAIVKDRCAAGLQVMGLRFRSDKLVPESRFAFLREQLGDAFVGVELDDEDANPDGLLPPHSVLTEHLIDEPGTRTRQALDDVLALFRAKLQTPTRA